MWVRVLTTPTASPTPTRSKQLQASSTAQAPWVLPCGSVGASNCHSLLLDSNQRTGNRPGAKAANGEAPCSCSILLTPGAPADLVFSASDLVAASECEYRTLRVLDEKLGRSPKADFPARRDAGRAGKLGDLHEHKVLAGLIAEYGPWDAAAAARASTPWSAEPQTVRPDWPSTRETAARAPCRCGRGLPGHLLRRRVPGLCGLPGQGGRRPPANPGPLCGLGHQAGPACQGGRPAAARCLWRPADQLGLEPAPRVTLVLGNLDAQRPLHLPDLLPVYRERRDRFRELTAAHRARGCPGAVAAARHQLLRPVRLLRRAGGRATGTC